MSVADDRQAVPTVVSEVPQVVHGIDKEHGAGGVHLAARPGRMIGDVVEGFRMRHEAQHPAAGIGQSGDAQRGAVGDAALKERDFEVMKSLMASIEMYDRGYSIKAVNLYKSLAKEWAVDEGEKCIYAPFQAVPNLSEKAAQSVVEARKDGEFISVEDLQDRTALSTSDIDRLRGLGTLDGLGETNQLTLF